jgi:hypothetical protein
MDGQGILRWLLVVCSLGGACVLAACDRDPSLQSAEQRSAVTPPGSVDSSVVAPPVVPNERTPAVESPKPEAKKADSKACLVLCKIGDELECGTPFPLCIQQCQEMLDVPKCSEEMQRALGCFAGQPARAWECDSASRMPTLKEGPCGEEQRLVAECMQA